MPKKCTSEIWAELEREVELDEEDDPTSQRSGPLARRRFQTRSRVTHRFGQGEVDHYIFNFEKEFGRSISSKKARWFQVVGNTPFQLMEFLRKEISRSMTLSRWIPQVE